MSQGLGMAFSTAYDGRVYVTVGDNRREQTIPLADCGDIEGIPHSVLAKVGQGVVRVINGTPQIFTLPKPAKG